jgi:hypothetical protein
MKHTNLSPLNDLLHPWIGAADDDESIAAYLDFDSNDETSVISVIRADIIPHLMTLPPEKRLAISQAVEEVQALPIKQIERIWDSILPPFYLPNPPSLLFRWIASEMRSILPTGNSPSSALLG